MNSIAIFHRLNLRPAGSADSGTTAPLHQRQSFVRSLAFLACAASVAYALGVAVGLPLPRVQGPASPAAGLLINAALIAGCAGHFHWVQKPGARFENWTVHPYVDVFTGALLQAAAGVALFFACWQPLPQQLWQVHGSLAVATLVCANGLALLPLLSPGRYPRLMLAGLCVLEWCAPRMTFGHLIFAAGFTLFVLRYRHALVQMTGDLKSARSDLSSWTPSR